MTDPSHKRVFIGWHAGIIPRAAQAIRDAFAHLSPLDFPQLAIIVPGRRVGRLLLQHLADMAPTPRPRIITPGQAIEELLSAPRITTPEPLLLELWKQALVRCGDVSLAALGARTEPDARARTIEGLAARIQRWRRFFEGEGCSLAQAADRLAQSAPQLAERLAEAARVELVYRALLDEHALLDRETARARALSNHCAAPVALLCVAQLPALVRRALLEQAQSTTAFIAAPEHEAPGFDELGCIRSDHWIKHPIPLTDDQIRFETTERDCAESLLAIIARDAGNQTADQVCVGVTDPSHAAILERTAARHDRVTLRPWEGRPPSETAFASLLRRIIRFREDQTFESFLSLLRHPDLEQYINVTHSDAPDWLDLLDVFYAQYLPRAMPRSWDRPGRTDWSPLAAIAQTITDLLEPRPTEDHLARYQRIITAIYPSESEPTDATAHAIVAAHTAAQHLARCLTDLPLDISPDRFIALILAELESVQGLHPPENRGAQIAGWLEIPWDPAPICAIMGLNEEFVPGPAANDPMLADATLAEAGIANRDDRFARDAYLMRVIAESKQRLTCIAARTANDATPLTPSRLLLACDTPTKARRILRFTAADPEPTPAPRLREPEPPEPIRFPVLPVHDTEPVTSMSVTSFKTYINSPYLFYLTRVLRLVERKDTARELGPLEYGTVLHAVLENFGRSPAANSTDRTVIEDYVLGELNAIREKRFGADPMPAVSLQLRFLEMRLRDFATWQAEHRAQGWTIEDVEWSPKEENPSLVVDGEPMLLRGTIDRIDRNERTGRVLLLDYKTGNDVQSPLKTHWTAHRGWIDLQLPLYRHLAAARKIDINKIDLAYVALPRDADSVDLLLADWTQEQLNEADARAKQVIRSIRNKEFHDPGTNTAQRNLSRTFASIAGTAVAMTANRSERS